MTLPRSDAPDPHGAGVSRDVEIVIKKGLHARASAKFVQHAEKFDAAIIVTCRGETVGATSIMGLMMLAAGPGSMITIKATGKEAAKAVEDLVALVADRFGEEEYSATRASFDTVHLTAAIRRFDRGQGHRRRATSGCSHPIHSGVRACDGIGA